METEITKRVRAGWRKGAGQAKMFGFIMGEIGKRLAKF